MLNQRRVPAANARMLGLLERTPGTTMNAATNPLQRSLTISAAVDPDDDTSLPGWIYSDPEFFDLEKRTVFRNAWQMVCHLNDIPQAGDYHRFDMLGEAVISVRGD